LNVPLRVLRKRIHEALYKAGYEIAKWNDPRTGKFPMNRFRRSLAQAMYIDVIYEPKVLQVEHVPRKGDRRSKVFIPNEIWSLAPHKAQYKTQKVSNLLHLIVAKGWKNYSRKLSHLLERLSLNIWTMTLKSFDGLLRCITSALLVSDKENCQTPGGLRKPNQNSIPGNWNVYFLKPRRKKFVQRTYGVKHLPDDLWLVARLKGHESYIPHVR